MSEKENTGGSGGSPVVVVESARHKTYRPELPESPTELHHKRSRAPGVPPVNEDLKEATENLDEIRDRKENERVSTEKHKHGITKKLSSITKKRSSSPEVITLTQVGLETKQDTVTPIPVQVASTTDLVAEKIEAVKENDDDSITEEMPEPRTSDDPKGSTKWVEIDLKTDETCVDNVVASEMDPQVIDSSKKKEISWNDSECQRKENLQERQTRSQMWILERKASIGPCYAGSRLGAPSGITICIPKKSLKHNSDEIRSMQSVINISISKKCLVNDTLRAENTREATLTDSEIEQKPCNKFLGLLRGKIRNVRTKIKSAFIE
ncbi:uncharacterized protein LOC101741456 isoform X2 [Bombyx mori]|uniref:uncharacterized protein LOC101741456 isoform X2 n=1 Tax=Bombyx mori TaxID=7091 RepID=UPI002ED39F71